MMTAYKVVKGKWCTPTSGGNGEGGRGSWVMNELRTVIVDPMVMARKKSGVP